MTVISRPAAVLIERDLAVEAQTHGVATHYWRAGVLLLLVLAALVRLWGIRHDLPFSFYGDELHMMKRAMAMGTGDLNPHWFHKPALLMYVLLGTYGGMYAVGRLLGWFQSPEQFGVSFLHDYGSFLLSGRLVVVAFGIVAVYFTYRLGRDVMRSRLGGLAAGVVAALVPGLVESGQHIKSDVPCAALMIAALSVYWRARGSRDTAQLLIAGLLSGAAMGMHFYAIVLLPTYAVLEMTAVWRGTVRLREALRAFGILSVTFCAAMFLVTPYTFLDREGTAYVKPGGDGINFLPGTGPLPYSGWWYTPAVHVVFVLASPAAFGPWLVVIALVGMIGLLRRPATRDCALLMGVPVVSFILVAAVVTRYHAEPRHLSPLYPILSIAVWAGALTIGHSIAAQRAATVACLVAVMGLLPATARTAENNRQKMLPDSRVVAYRWITTSLPREGRVLLDDYGPQLPLSAAAVQRLQARLAELPSSPFTAHQGHRLALLAKYPSKDGFDVEELGHQWWVGRELTDHELRGSAFHLDMGSPLVSRVPKTLTEYRALGFRWVVTNSLARSRYRPGYRDRDRFPSFAAFYDDLPRSARLVRDFDPAEWGGKGPVIWIYDLQTPSLSQ